MNASEPQIHSFVIKLWVEQEIKGNRVWHGYITHVTSKERRYLRSLGDIAAFIAPYLGETGIRPGWWWRYRRRWS